jgi:hypothetical protein
LKQCWVSPPRILESSHFGLDHLSLTFDYLAYIKSKHFKDRPLFIDARNKTEAIKIRTRETGPKPKGVKRYSHPTARSQSRRTSSKHYGRQKRFGSSSNQAPLQASVSTPRFLRTPGIIKMNNGAVNASNVVEMMAYNDFWTISAVGAFIHKPLPWPYYPPTLVFPSYGWTYCCGTSSCAPYPFVYEGAPMPLIPEQEAIMPGSANDDIQSCLDEPQSAARGRRVQSIPPSFRWAGNETFE